MACIVSLPTVTDVEEIYSTKNDVNEKDFTELDIFKNTEKLNNEKITHSQKDEKNIEENLRNICDITSLNEKSYSNQEKIENNETSDALINNIHLSNGINLNEFEKEIELKVMDKKYCDVDNSSNTIKKRYSNLIDSDSIEKISLYGTLNKNSNADNKYHFGSPPKTDLQIAEHKNNLKNKSIKRIINNESEKDTQTSKSYDFPQRIHHTLCTTAESYWTLIDSESEEEKQDEETESKKDTQTSESNNLPEIVHTSTTDESYRVLVDSEPKKKKQNKKMENNTHIIFTETSENKDVKRKSLKKRKGSVRASKDEAMRQIHSESQRLLRETEISLPYHKPKQRTLQEFLNRKKILAALPKAPSTAAKLKMSSAIVSQVLAEKEKEAELFYKSSDSEDDVQQTMPSVSIDIKKSSITNEREMPSIYIQHTYIQNSKRFEGSNRDSQDEKEIQKNHLDLNAYKVLLQKDFCKVDHQTVELSSLIDNNCNLDNGSDILLPQVTNKYNQNLPKLSLSRKLVDIHFENELNDDSEVNLDEQEVIKERVKIITSLNKDNCINNDKKSKITITENQISKVHQDDSEVINGRDKNSVTMMKIETSFNNSINSKEITKTFQSDNDITDNIMCSNSDECSIICIDKNNKQKNQYFTINDVSSSSLLVTNDTQSKLHYKSSTDECEKIDGHVQGLPLPKFADETLMNRKELSERALVLNSKVTLRGSPGMIIDLTDDAKSNIKDIDITLLDRFFCKHVNSEKQNDNKSEITVVHLQNTQNGLLPIKKVLPYKIPVNIDNSELNKPGAKLMRLKEDLKLQMILKRNKEWEQKETELQTQEEKEWNKEIKSDYDLDEQETELNFELNDSEESEPEENNVCINDKKKSRCLFADDEVEVTDNEDSNTEETYNESKDYITYSKQSTNFKYRKEYMDDDVSVTEIDQEEEEEEEEEEDDDDDDDDNDDDDNDVDKYGEGKKGNKESLDINMENGNESDFKDVDNVNTCESFSITKNKNNRKTKQLIKEFQNDSNVINPSYLRNDSNQLNMAIDIDTFKTHCEDIDWISENENNMSVCQQHLEVATRSRICKTPLTKTSMLDLVSPITQLSVLNTILDFNEKDSSQKKECLVDKHEILSMESTQNDESPEHICNVKNKSILKKKLFDDIGETVNDEYLIQLCSGKFESTQRTDLDLLSQSNTTELQLRSSDSKRSENSNATLVDVELQNSKDKRFQNIKLTLDEDFNNSVNHAKKKNNVSAMDLELELRVTSSNDEDEDTFLKPKKRLAKILNLSDSEEENSQFFDKENDVNNEKVETQYVDYDSEENEIVIVPEKDIKKVAADFVEEEAELSESDWDSADEDEKDLDKLEFEEADDEHIDEHEVQDQLEKIHIKQILDEDKRKVRLLKELLFEDGDLHTDGMRRERKFKWKNIDKLGNNIEISDENDGWVNVQEDEEEAEWNKLRNKRDKFLEERMKCLNNEIEDELRHSQIFKLGLQAVKKIKDNESQRQDTSLDKINSSENIEPIMPRNITDLLNGPSIGKKYQMTYNVIKKRSLLTRGEESLARIASLAKQGDSVCHAVNTRNFVFPHIDQSSNNTFNKKTEIITDLDSHIKPGKRKMNLNMSTSKKKRK